MESAWVIAPQADDDIVRQLLLNRGIAEADHAEFLMPNWETGIHAWSLFTAMPRAVARVFAALERGERMVIHGDYDADGVCGSSLLYEAIREIAEKFPAFPPLQLTVYLPDREKDGYGVALHTVERLAGEGTKLLMTVDCGIANADQLDRAHDLGMDVIVCDHHQLGERLPAHALLLHPLVPGEIYPNKTLCGTGVAFKLASALFAAARTRGAAFPPGHEKWFLDLVAIATVTDVMPLVGENRVLEYFGLTVLRKTRRHGIHALLSSAGTTSSAVDTETIGFRIGPRLNAAGRLASAGVAFRALTARTPEDAVIAAGELETLNRARQRIFTAAYEDAKALAASSSDDPVLVVAKDDWLPGIVGLIAGRLASDFHKPAFAFAAVNGHYVGSGRSVGGLHLVEAMASCGDIFVRRGGHPQACGLTIANNELLTAFRKGVCTFAHDFFGGASPVRPLMIDAILPFAAVTWEVVAAILQCAPFGEGNRAPLFLAPNLTVRAVEPMGSTGAHVRLRVVDDAQVAHRVIAFHFAERAAALTPHDRVDIVYAVEVNEWKGRREIQFRLHDVRLA